MRRVVHVLLGLCFLIVTTAARADTEIRVAKQYGLGYLTLMVMEDQQLIEKQARAAGIPDPKVTWATFRSSDVMIDTLLSANVDFVSLGVAGLATVWAKTQGTANPIKGVLGMNALPYALVTRDPRIKTIGDYTANDRIAVPALKVSMQAILLQMAADKLYGDHLRLDPLTVTMRHPDALAVILSGNHEVKSHFATPPFMYIELAAPGVHKVSDGKSILGGPLSFNVIAASEQYRSKNPKSFKAFIAAYDEATAWINANPRQAAEAYVRITKEKATPDEILAMMRDPDAEFTAIPRNVKPVVDFMNRVGTIKVKPASWKDLFFPEAHGLAGS
ncbi:MAG: ABC transporter substrate-binding protein [Casimicrobiaceae bacterium]